MKANTDTGRPVKFVCFASGSCAFESFEEGVSEREIQSELLQQMTNKPNEKKEKKIENENKMNNKLCKRRNILLPNETATYHVF